MRVYISKSFASALEKEMKEKFDSINTAINILKDMSQSDIVASKDIIELTNTKDMVLYAYNIQASKYIVFTFEDENRLVLLDEIELIEDEIKSLVYP